ncbi:hypothetical protein F5144DRAFT_138189 [Chaetomium tenue]|uniref:Uncharacterized protein n=1 Tax=Chaetomium tenue TaxID=1854479 RepID=A0ACB7PIY5_9PEZI|nr:hypothetical protein F5144DRAFT_138189 [Chaetomium globosum]
MQSDKKDPTCVRSRTALHLQHPDSAVISFNRPTMHVCTHLRMYSTRYPSDRTARTLGLRVSRCMSAALAGPPLQGRLRPAGPPRVVSWLSRGGFPNSGFPCCVEARSLVYFYNLSWPPPTARTLGSIANTPTAERIYLYVHRLAHAKLCGIACGAGSGRSWARILPVWDPRWGDSFLDRSSPCTVLAWKRAGSRCVTAGKP